MTAGDDGFGFSCGSTSAAGHSLCSEKMSTDFMTPCRIESDGLHNFDNKAIVNQYTLRGPRDSYTWLCPRSESGNPMCKSEDGSKTAIFADSCPDDGERSETTSGATFMFGDTRPRHNKPFRDQSYPVYCCGLSPFERVQEHSTSLSP